MIIVPKINHLLGFGEAKELIRKELERLAATTVEAERYPLAIRIEVPIVPLSPLLWLARQEVLPRTFWCDRDTNAAYAGVGSAWEDFSRTWGDGAEIWEGVQALLNAEKELRVVAGMCFHRVVTGPEWRSLKSIRFFVPRFEIEEDERGVRMVCNVILGEGEKLPLRHVLKELESLRLIETISSENVVMKERSSSPHFEQWTDSLRAVLEEIRAGKLEKAVLSRRVALAFSRAVDPVDILIKLRDVHAVGYAFYYQFSDAQAFLGVSPELLYSRSGDVLCGEAVAGTRARGQTVADDEVLERELLSSDKDAREHKLVVAALVSAFRQACRSYTVDERVSVMKLPGQQHLFTRITGRLTEGVSDYELCCLLHPSPSVGGVPTDNALQIINRIEGFDRGWYASPVGYFKRDSAKLAVAIRSCLAVGDLLYLYSGAGIVEGSSPLDEWDEVELKLKHYLDIFYAR